MGKTTRDADLDKLDSSRFNRKEEGSKEHVEAMLALVHAQSKDATLEKLRTKLMAVLNQLEQGETDELWIEYTMTIERIERYCKSPEFLKRMHDAIYRNAGSVQADLYVQKHVLPKM